MHNLFEQFIVDLKLRFLAEIISKVNKKSRKS